MASGWWKSSYANLESPSPNDFTVHTGPTAPRGYPKISSIATGDGMFLGGTPAVTFNDIIYYAGDNYTQDVGAPTVMRWDGRVNTILFQVPNAGTGPAKAVLSMAIDSNGTLYVSTWDSGTTSSTFAGRVLKYNPTTSQVSTFGDDVFKNGRLPYCLVIHAGKLWVGVTRQDPSKQGSIYSIHLTTSATTQEHRFSTGEISSPAITSVVRNTTANTYKITTKNPNNVESGPSAPVTYVGDPVLDGSTYNTLSWSAASGASSYNIYRTAGHTSQGKITNTTGTSYADTGAAGDSTSPPAAPSTAKPTSVGGNSLTQQAITYQYAATCTRNGNESYGLWGDTFLGPTVQYSDSNNTNIFVNIPDTDGNTIVNIYRVQGPQSPGFIKSVQSSPGSNSINVFDNTPSGNGTYPLVEPPSLNLTPTDPTVTTSYQVTANTTNGETLPSNTVSTQAKATLTSSRNVTVTWGAVGGASSYDVYRTAGHTSTGRIVDNTGATSAVDTGLAGSGTPTDENTTGAPLGGTGSIVPFTDDLYVGLYEKSGTFSTVQKIDQDNVRTTSDTIAPGGSAAAYNGFTAGTVFEGNLYMAYWNNDATPKTLIRKFDGSVWSTVLTISGAGARPFIAFHEHNGTLYAYGGGDAQSGIFYTTTDGLSWTDRTALLPTSQEAIPFMGTVNILGGF